MYLTNKQQKNKSIKRLFDFLFIILHHHLSYGKQ